MLHALFETAPAAPAGQAAAPCARATNRALRPSRIALAVFAAATCHGAAVRAQDAAAVEPASTASPVAAADLSPVVVTATRTERRQLDVPASVDVIDRDTLRDAQLRVNLSESLGRVPGLVILNRQNYAQDLQLSIRGFGSRSTFGVRLWNACMNNRP